MKTRENCQSYVELLEMRADARPDKIVFTFLESGDVDGPRRSISYAELATRAKAVAVALRSRVAEGGTALLVFPSSLEFVIAFCGCLYAGILPVPTPPPDPSRIGRALARTAGILRDSGAEL